MKKLILLSAISLAFVGCKTDVISSITTDDLMSDAQKSVQGIVEVEVLSCNDFNDSRNESRSLIEAKAKVSHILKGSEYKECYKKQFKSYAVFSTPIVVGSGRSGVNFIDGDIYILNNDDAYLSAILSPDLIEKIKREEQSFSSMSKIDLNMTIGLKKGDSTIPDLIWEGVYLSDDPANVKKHPHIMK